MNSDEMVKLTLMLTETQLAHLLNHLEGDYCDICRSIRELLLLASPPTTEREVPDA